MCGFLNPASANAHAYMPFGPILPRILPSRDTNNERSKNMKSQLRWLAGAAVVTLAVVSAVTIGSRLVHGQADHVRWDILDRVSVTPLPTFNAGGVAFAAAR